MSTNELSIHVMYGPTYILNDDNDTVDDEYGSARLVGFQDERDVQTVNLFAADWRKAPESALRKFPVFSRGKGGIYTDTRRVTVVRYNGKRFI